MDRNSFSYILLVISSILSALHLSWMTFYGKFTFTYIGMIFIILYGLQIFAEYNPLANLDNTQPRSRQPAPVSSYVQYRRFSPSQHHHISSHRFQVDESQPDCTPGQSETNIKSQSIELTILQFCVYLLTTSFFTTDLFFAYQVFSPDLNYLPLLGGLLNIIPALYIKDGRRISELFIFTIPANCWGQVYYGGFRQNNIFAMLAGYLFFVAYYYNDLQRTFKGMAPQTQANYYMSSFCIFASLALNSAFDKFNVKNVKVK